MSLLDYFFKKSKKSGSVISKLSLEPVHNFSAWTGNAYSNDIYRGAVDSIAKQAAKLKGSHIISSNNAKHYGDCGINNLLQCSPNPLLSAYDFLYIVITQSLCCNYSVFTL